MKILFIGNSHTFYNAMPFQTREILRETGTVCEVHMIANGGATLGWHAEQSSTITNITFGEFTHIVLQQKSHPFDGVEALLADCSALAPALNRSGASVFLYNTWPEQDKPENHRIIDDAICQAAHHFGFGIVPVSAVWFKVLAECPGIELYDTDREHASRFGSYLTAATMACTLGKTSSLRLPARLTINNSILADVGVDGAAAIGRAIAEITG